MRNKSITVNNDASLSKGTQVRQKVGDTVGEKYEWGEHSVSDKEILLAGYGQHQTLSAAQAHCTDIARSHYENFIIANKFTPADKRQHIENIYAYCRYGDDLGDEAPFSDEIRWQLLDEWEDDLARAYGLPKGKTTPDELAELEANGQAPVPWSGVPKHPILIAIAHTSTKVGIPYLPYWKLIQAFKMDQKKKRYETWEELRKYCYYSADPVGHLFLYVYGHDDEEMRAKADNTCTALQLANHWQDVSRDLQQGRSYLPTEDLERFGYTSIDLENRVADHRWKELMKYEVDRAQKWFDEGKTLWDDIDPLLAVDLQMFTMGGEAILESIRKQNYDTWKRRPRVGKLKQFFLLLKVRRLWKRAQRKARV